MPSANATFISTTLQERSTPCCTVSGENGTGHTARPAGYMIGGKTGTAETLPRGNNEYVVSFMGYAPADDPQVVIYVVVDRPNVVFQDDAKYATKIVKKILTEVLPYMNIFMTEELSDTEREELEQLQIQIRTPQGAEPEEELDEEGNPIPKEGEEGSPAEGEGAAPAEGEEGAEGSEEEPAGPNEAWKDFPLDPETGYLVDPATGDYYDPQIGTQVGRGDSQAEESGEGTGEGTGGEWSPAPPPGDGEDTGEP